MTKIEESFYTFFVEKMSRTTDLSLISVGTDPANQKHGDRFQHVMTPESFMMTEVVCFFAVAQNTFEV